MKKRLLSMLLVVCMVATMLPVSVFAAGDYDYNYGAVVEIKGSNTKPEGSIPTMSEWGESEKSEYATCGEVEHKEHSNLCLSCKHGDSHTAGCYNSVWGVCTHTDSSQHTEIKMGSEITEDSTLYPEYEKVFNAAYESAKRQSGYQTAYDEAYKAAYKATYDSLVNIPFVGGPTKADAAGKEAGDAAGKVAQAAFCADAALEVANNTKFCYSADISQGVTCGHGDSHVENCYKSEFCPGIHKHEEPACYTYTWTLKDLRPATEIVLTDSVTITYNRDLAVTEAELHEKLDASAVVKEDDGDIVANAEITVSHDGDLNAGEETITLSYAGDDNHAACTAEIEVTVNKAPVDVTVNNNVVKYGEEYEVTVITEPEVSTIQFVIGLDVADMYLDGEEIAGTTMKVNVILPGELGEIINGTFTGGELISAIETAKPLLVYAGVPEETLTALTTTLTALEEQFGELKISINDELPTNIGVYAVGAITADVNYETEIAVGYLIITPNGIKAEMEWNQTDDNHIVTLDKLSKFDLNAKATVVESTVDNAENWSDDAATKQIEYLFLGVDSKGELMLNSDPAQMKNANTGVYTQIAYMINWGNDVYYAEPIARPIIVSPNVADVDILDVNGNENYAQVYTYGDEITLNVAVDGVTAPVDGLTVKYIGSDTTVDGWYRDEVPTDAGVYTVVAVYTEKDTDGQLAKAGGTVGVLVIEPADAEIGLKDAEYCYDGEEHFATLTNEAMDYVTVAIDRENNIAYVNLPEDTADHVERIVGMLPDEAAAEVLSQIQRLLEQYVNAGGKVDSTELQADLIALLNALEEVDLTGETKALAQELVDQLAAELEGNEEIAALIEKIESEITALGDAVQDQIPAELEDYLRNVISVSNGLEIDVDKVKDDLRNLLSQVELPEEIEAEMSALVEKLASAAEDKLNLDELQEQVNQILDQLEALNLDELDAKTVVKYMLGAIFSQVDMDELKDVLTVAAAKVEARGYMDYLKNMGKAISGMYEGEVDTETLDSALQELTDKVEEKLQSGSFDADDLENLETYVDNILMAVAEVVEQIPAGTFVFGKNPTEPGKYDCYAMNISANYKWEFVEATLTINDTDGHKWDEGVKTAEPDCENDGAITYTCSVCGATKEDPIEKLGHDYEETERVNPTATKNGYILYTCKNDPNHTYTKVLPKTGSGEVVTPSKPVLNKKEHFAFLSGYPDGTFRSDNNMTRAEVAAMFYNLVENKTAKVFATNFSDVDEDIWYAEAIGYMERYGIMSGYPDGTFHPNAPITRAEFAAVATAFDNLTEGESNFSDVSESDWFYTFVSFAAEKGWVSGYPDGTFRPAKYISRAEVTAVTCKLLERMADKDYVLKHEDDLARTFVDLPDEDAHWAYWFIVESTNGHDYVKVKDEENWKDINQ